MTGTLGSLTLTVGLVAALTASGLWIRSAVAPAGGGGTSRGRTTAPVAAGRATLVLLLAVLGACGLMEYALITHDFSVRFVAEVGGRDTPLYYTVTSLWSGLDGSLLLWLLVLAVYALLLARTPPPGAERLHAWAMACVCAVTSFFFCLVVFATHPFARVSPVPLDGPGPNPLLRDSPFMGIHPPLLYAGYVGLIVPFAFALAALAVGEADALWLRITRTWTLVAWSCLTGGIVLGAWWSYTVLGWGGYWAWDPVENASLLPWLTATALLHSMLVQRDGGRLPGWNVTLAAASFVLVSVGTLLTRSGALRSVHAFTASSLGPMLLGFLAVVVAVVVWLLVNRAHLLAPAGEPPTPSSWALLSRETFLLLNNLLLTTVAGIVFVGTTFPVLARGLWGEEIAVGAPYYDRMTVPAALALLTLMIVGPLARGGQDDLRRLTHELLGPVAVVAAVVAALGLAGVPGPLTVAALGLAAGVAVVAVRGIVRTTRPRGPRRRGAVPARAWQRRRRLGGQLAHLGLAVAAAGVAASSSYTTATEGTVRVGEAVHLGARSVRLVAMDQIGGAGEGPVTTRADIEVSDGRSSTRRMSTRLRFYPSHSMTVSSPGIAGDWSGDTYVTLLSVSEDGRTAQLRVSRDPLVGWLWLGGALVVCGGALAVGRGARPGPGRRAPVERRDRTRPGSGAASGSGPTAGSGAASGSGPTATAVPGPAPVTTLPGEHGGTGRTP